LQSKFWNEEPMTTSYGTASARYHHLQIINSSSNFFILMFTMKYKLGKFLYTFSCKIKNWFTMISWK